MKKIVIPLCCVLVVSLYAGIFGTNQGDSIYNKIIRFHVIANSDSVQDQALKLKVKDNILQFISPKLKNSKSIEETRRILQENDKEICAIALNTIKGNGYSYSVGSSLLRENFPPKSYGNITLPQGNYEAYKVVIGEGKGKNWWCVMFPPLCFVDITKGTVAYKETEQKMKTVLTDRQFEEINNTSNVVQLKFKIFEIISKIKQRAAK